MNRRTWNVIAALVVMAFGAAACNKASEPSASASTVAEAPPEESAVIPFRWNVPDHLAGPLRNCENNTSAALATWQPCLKDTFRFTIGKSLAVTGHAYSVKWNGDAGTLALNMAPYQVFMVVANINGSGWQPLGERPYSGTDLSPTYDTATGQGINWLRGKTYEVVVTLWDPKDPENKSSNRRGVDVPFTWAEILPQRLGKS